MMDERNAVEANFQQLLGASRTAFPAKGKPLNAPASHGVYVIYSCDGRVSHVGRTVRGKAGLHQRLNNHLNGKSSFVQTALQGDGSKLRISCQYGYVVIHNSRLRALVEAYAIGMLCPEHLGHGGVDGERS